MRIEFINSTGGKMLVDESRVEEYKEAGYMLASKVIDAEFVEDKKPRAKKTTKKNEV